MLYHNLFHIQEGVFVSEDIKERFSLSNEDLNDTNNNCKFTGLVIKNKDVLIAWPKHFHKVNDLNTATLEQTRLLFDILVKYTKRLEESSLLNDASLDTSNMFPIISFSNIFSYYKKYGLYKEENIIKKQGYAGKIDWRNTITKSNKIISNNQLLFIPFFIKEKHSDNVFLSECMAYVINETYEMLSFLFSNRIHIDLNYNRYIFKDKEFILNKLRSLKEKIFKDIDKRLLQDLINYFKSSGSTKELKYKNYNFKNIWELMIEDYLNSNVKKITRNTIEFESHSNVFNFQKKTFHIGGRNIEIDHYYEDDKYSYILDSKYYQELESLDYKQVAYDYFIKSKVGKPIVNALIISSDEDRTKTHLNYKKDDVLIMSHFLSIQKIMRDCSN